MKTFPVILKLSISTLLENRLRSILTLTGMVFGTAAVIATLSSNSGAQKYISQQLANLGTKLMTATLRSGEITPSDLVVLTRYIPDIDAAVLEKKIPNVPVRQKLTEITSSAYAVDQGFFKAVGLSISNGRDFTDFDYEYPEANVILGYKLRESLFGLTNPYCWISPSLSHPISPSLSHPLSPGLNHLIS